MRPIRRLALLAGLVIMPAGTTWGQSIPSASFRNGFFGPFDGYSAIWAYPTDLSNGPSPYYSPIFNGLAASRPAPSLEPSPYARSPLDLLRFNRPFSGRERPRLFLRR